MSVQRNKELIAILLSVTLPLATAGLLFWYRSFSAPPKKAVLGRGRDAWKQAGKCSVVRVWCFKFKQFRLLDVSGLEQPMVIAMVGLPARGKSYIVKMLSRYLKWAGFDCRNFNVGSYRRKIGHQGADASFFDTTNKDAQRLREDMAQAVQDDMYEWLRDAEQRSENKLKVAIFDATNTTKSRRLLLAQRARQEKVFLLFVESICTDTRVLNRNYELKLQNDDYKEMDKEKAREDFMNRVHAYEKVYQTIEDDEDGGQISYIKLINVGQKIIARNCTGFLPSQVAFYLQNIHILPRKIFLCLNAQSEEMALHTGRISDSESGRLTEQGKQFGADLAAYMHLFAQDGQIDGGNGGDVDGNNGNIGGDGGHEHSSDEAVTTSEKPEKLDKPEKSGKFELLVLAGTSKAHMETVLHLRTMFKCFHTTLLNELRGGDLHGLTRQEVQDLYPEEYARRQSDKLRYRYPGVGGESYMDVIERIRPVIIELERQRRSVLVICHLAVLRCIAAYFLGARSEEIPQLQFEPHRIYELTPGPFGCSMRSLAPEDELRHI